MKLVRETLYEKMSLIYPKNKWVNLDVYDKDYLKDELFTIIDKAYSPIGGHVRINSPDAVENDKDLTYWNAINIEGDDADAVLFGKKTQFGYKISGIGHNGKKESKQELMSHLAKLLHKPGYYIEISDRPAEILVKNYYVSFIDTPEEIEKLFPGSKVQWVGKHPEHPSVVDGFYRRSIEGGMTGIEIVLGKPKI